MSSQEHQLSSFIEKFQAADIRGLRACLESLPTVDQAREIVDWILANGQNLGVVLSKDLDDGLFVLSQLNRAYPLSQSLRNTALACALVGHHPGMAAWSIDLGVDPDAMCEPEGTSLLGMMAHMDTSNAPVAWRAMFPRLLASARRPQIVNPAIINDEVLLEQWLTWMPPLSQPAQWARLEPQANLGEVVVDAAYLAPLLVLKKLMEAGFPCDLGKAVFMALIRGNSQSACLLLTHAPDPSVLIEYRTEENETLLHAIAHRERAMLLVDPSEAIVQQEDYLALLPVLLAIDPRAKDDSGKMANEIAPSNSPLLGWISATREVRKLQTHTPLSPSMGATRRI